ncbi:excinuclease ABC subunit UvrA [Candidatus Azobacteroides pseudotrichonymphae]|uniref:UvrABC system protein A n=1 Tax=Azobacteroides pseudotrichonymphae genomovar. CFP2 TaxID=511995 RepID=B6YR13_AZOPC|nr:excinuclease ABC subunit UvrA [Candidatus Azobacteroides pseudotrichonymphae]BAG83635.1 excinuclease ABC subunit A [Candidatus Azobacteroides pseudotrichonymphae genomovar. CFP2]
MTLESNIVIKGARVNNLKNIDVEIPLNKFTVITGLSGSGKSSLAFDTLYAEGRRRYVESLSTYARQFFGKISKPEVDFIKGLPPAIAIGQKVNTHNSRSTVGTSTEIYNYLCMLFARIGKTISPITGKIVYKHQTSDVIDEMSHYPNGTRIVLLTQIIPTASHSIEKQLSILIQEGFSRIEIDGEIYHIGEILGDKILSRNVYLVIDRFIINNDLKAVSRFSDSIETAFLKGNDSCVLHVYTKQGIISKEFSRRFEDNGIEFEEPSDRMFNYNSPIGACPTCEGLGIILGISEKSVIPDTSLSIYDDAIVCWKGDKMSEWKQGFIKKSSYYKFPIYRPYKELTQEEKDLLWHGNGSLHGINDFFKYVEENLYKIQYRVMYARYRGKTTCPVCKGKRLKHQALYVKIGEKNITDLMTMSVNKVKFFFENLQLTKYDAQIAKRLLIEIDSRLQFLNDVGLGYLTLDRLSSTLSGGESQRINLITALGNNLVGSLYILDEPSIGLHSKDTTLLIRALRKLQALGNTVIVVEHDERIICSADYIIDMGPKAGRNGGEIIYRGKIDELDIASESHTVRFLTGKEIIEVPVQRRKWNNFIEIKNARKNNLKGFDVRFPLNVMTVVTGVSGSGKSSLVCDVFYQELKQFYESNRETKSVFGDLCLIECIEFIDQSSIGRSTRSNPVTYIKAYDEIRKLFAGQPLAKQLNFTSSYFSFNIKGGRCEECKGEGTITVEMQFMADVILKCETCQGKRFKQDILDIEYHNKNIYDVLNMTIDEAIDFFKEREDNTTKKIIHRMQILHEVGLGYVKLGQSSATLSGGENQRLKLAYHLVEDKKHPTLFIFDEPTTGLHFFDIKTLIHAFNELITYGHTIVIIEHNMDIIKTADYIIDLGPEGGENGGYLIGTGTPEEITKNRESVTGKFLKAKLY